MVIKIFSNNYKIIQLKLSYILKFFFIYNICSYKIFYNKKKNIRLKLLKSPHVFKTAWQNYNINMKYKVNIYLNEILLKKILIKFFCLLKFLSKNCIIKIIK